MRNFDYNALAVLTYSLDYAAKALLLKKEMRTVRVSPKSSDAPSDSQLLCESWVLGTPGEYSI